ncbi:6-pyruvoyl-tetrahydropterin synthase-related protein [Methanopyrus sp.]
MDRKDVLCALVAFMVGTVVSSPSLNYGWNWFPSGADARGHMTKVWMLEKLWSMGDVPYPKWSEYWYCGYPFLWFYPPLSYFIPALITHFVKTDVLTAWKWWTWLAYSLAGPSVYASARLMGASPLGSLIAAVAYQTSYNHIEITFTEGRIPTVAAIVFYALVPGLLVAVYRRVWERGRWAGYLALVLSLTVLTHHSSGLAAITVCLVYVALRVFRSWTLWAVGKEELPSILPEVPGHAWVLSAILLSVLAVSWWLVPALEYRTYSYTTKPKWWISMSSVHDPWEFFVPGYWKTRYAKYVGAVQFFLGWSGLILAARRRPRTFFPFAIMTGVALLLSFGLVLQKPMERIGFEPKWFLMFSAVILCTFVAFVIDNFRSLRRHAVLIMICSIMMIDAAIGLKYAYRPIHYTVSELSALLWVKEHTGPWDRVATVGYRALWGMEPYITGAPSVFGWYREGTPIRDIVAQYQRSFKRIEPNKALKIGDVLGVRFLILSSRKPCAKRMIKELECVGVRPICDYRWVRVYEFNPIIGYEMDGVKSVFLGNKYRYMRLCKLLRYDPKYAPAYAFTRIPNCDLVRYAHPQVVVMDKHPSPEEVRALKEFGVKEILVLDRYRKSKTKMFGINIVYDRPLHIAKMLPKRNLKPIRVDLGHAWFKVYGRGWVWAKVPYFPCWIPDRGVRLGGIDNMILLRVPSPTTVKFVWNTHPLWIALSAFSLCVSLYLTFSRRWRT